MNKKHILIWFILFFNHVCFSQTPNPKDCSVELWCTVQTNPPTITLNWLPNTGTTNYAIARKPKNSSTWTTISATNPSSTTQYVDNTVSLATHYEYRVLRTAVTGTTNYQAFGYINSGIQIPETENRGKLILLIADNFSVSLLPEIKRLQDDLEGDGWEVLTTYASTNTPVPAIKSQIVNTYNLDPINTKALFIIGHIAVPYSGNFGPDAHNDHQGAWPADVYYGEMNGTWTDVSVTSTTLSPPRTQNIPNDGKFDQTQIPSNVELQVGRVDLSAMPSFTASETQLLKNYLDKDHNYRKKVFSPLKRAVIDDNFGAFFPAGEAFASSGFKNFGPLVTPTNVSQADYFTSMTGNSYQWSYGCGGGWFQGASGIGSTSNFASSNLQGVFTMLFGSYFGDWDVSDNFLRAPLCQGQTLTNAWAGRPNWMFHHIAMGENIGYSTQLTQNNISTYYASPYSTATGIPNAVHIALMGDPSLRNDIVAPVSNVVATKVGNNCNISWSASTETALVGYNIYMKNDTNKTYVKINPLPITGTTFTDNCLQYPGIYKYMVRALKLEVTPSGSYYNMSEGIADTAYNTNYYATVAQYSTTQNGNVFTFNNTSVNALNYLWNFGNGQTSNVANPVVTYTANGTYTVSLTALNNCASNTYTSTVTLLNVSLNDLSKNNTSFNFYPNPSHTFITLNTCNRSDCSLSVISIEGKIIYYISKIKNNQIINVSEFKKGIYLLKLTDKNNVSENKKLIVE